MVVFSPLFVLAPLAGLLIASRPTTIREWAWIAAALLWVLATVGQSSGLATDVKPACALFVTGAFVALMLPGRRQLVSGALLATLVGFGAATAWVWVLGIRWQDIQLAVAHDGWESFRQLLAQGDLSGEMLERVRGLLDALTDGYGVMADLLPAVLILTALPGLALAWTWYHRLSAHPAGRAEGRFAEFRFNDHLVWLVVIVVTGLVLPLPDAVQGILSNLALITGVLYAARGAAIAWTSVERFHLVLRIVLTVVAAGILPVALGGFFALGLADTWVDFRRRFHAAESKQE